MAAERQRTKPGSHRKRRRPRLPLGRRLGAAAVSLLVHLLWIAGLVCLLLGAVLVGSHLVIWRGLDFPVDSRRGLALLAGGIGLLLAGAVVYRGARRVL